MPLILNQEQNFILIESVLMITSEQYKVRNTLRNTNGY